MRIEKIIYFLVCGNKNEAGKIMITPHTADVLLLGFHFPGLMTLRQKKLLLIFDDQFSEQTIYF